VRFAHRQEGAFQQEQAMTGINMYKGENVGLTLASKRAIDSVNMGRHLGALSLFVTVVMKSKLHGITITHTAAAMWEQRAGDLCALREWKRCTQNDIDIHRAITADVSAMIGDIERGMVDIDVALERAANELATRR